LGVGINVQPSAVLILRNLGLLPQLLETGIATRDLNFYNPHGDLILSEPRGQSAGYSIPQISIHRGELQGLLLRAVKERLGEGVVRLGHKLAGFEQDEDGTGVTAFFERRRSRGEGEPEEAVEVEVKVPEMRGSVLIAADGINSSARRLLYPDEGPPRFSGRILWRGCLEREPYLSGKSMIWAGHADQKFIAYPISAVSQGKRPERSLVNWIAELRVRGKDDPDLKPPPVDWTRSVPKERFEGPFQGWRCGGVEMAELIKDTERVYEFPMCDRDPVGRWSFGRLTLLGDSAHAMYPIGSNGASQAILDAEALVGCLLGHGVGGKEWAEGNGDGVEKALEEYQKMRLPPTSAIVYANRGNGPDQVLQLAHERAPDGFKHVYDVIPKEELEGVGAKYKAIAGFEIEAVNKKAKETEGKVWGKAAVNGQIEPVAAVAMGVEVNGLK
jgi:2-polyprenyl-6-methoxyphenol hydroxylase-like FAD-dependent oxidoreductase